MRKTKKIWMDGKLIDWDDAKIHILTHALHYGTACFDGIRGNWNEQQQLFLFRVKDHYERMHKGCRLLKITLPYSVDELCRLTVEVVDRSGYREDVYVRPMAYKSSEAIGVRLHDLEDDFFIVVAILPAYLDADKGVRCLQRRWSCEPGVRSLGHAAAAGGTLSASLSPG